MKNKLEFLKSIHELLKNPNPESLNLSMADTHHEGLFSLVIGGTEFGKLTRVFISDKKLNPFEVQLHSHRYSIQLTTIKGQIQHHRAVRVDVFNDDGEDYVSMSEFNYKSPLNGGDGLKYLGEINVILKDNILPIGSSLYLSYIDLHTISCDESSIWIVEEKGFQQDSSRVLGVPFITDGLYNKPLPFQINDKVELVKREIKKLILDYELV
jgi:hypothetical protein